MGSSYLSPKMFYCLLCFQTQQGFHFLKILQSHLLGILYIICLIFTKTYSHICVCVCARICNDSLKFICLLKCDSLPRLSNIIFLSLQHHASCIKYSVNSYEKMIEHILKMFLFLCYSAKFIHHSLGYLLWLSACPFVDELVYKRHSNDDSPSSFLKADLSQAMQAEHWLETKWWL